MTRLFRVICRFLLLACVAACSGVETPPSEGNQGVERQNGPAPALAELRLYTIVATETGTGVHTALMIETPEERLLFDPAGSYRLKTVSEKGDVLYGITPETLEGYVDYHAREGYDVLEQRVPVTLDQARVAASLVKGNGSVPKLQCALMTSRLLKRVPGFGDVSVSYFPRRLAAFLATHPDTRERHFIGATSEDRG